MFAMPLPLIFADNTTPINGDALGAALESRGVVMVVLLVLLALSVASWFVIGAKWWELRKTRAASRVFLEAFWASRQLDAMHGTLGQYAEVPVVVLFRAAHAELGRVRQLGLGASDGALDNVDRALRRASQESVERLERWIAFLGSVASAAPFIGLFGTVWGIMGAFGGIAGAENMLQSVAPHIAQALVATAVGLLAAIPAVMAYNALSGRVRQIVVEMDGFALELLNLVRRQIEAPSGRAPRPE